MKHKYFLILIISLSVPTGLLILFLLIHCCKRVASKDAVSEDLEAKFEYKERDGVVKEELIRFDGGENLSVNDILEAPGEVIGKSGYGTLYKACLVKSNSFALLRFLRPACTLRIKEVVEVIELLGCVRHVNLVPLYAFYAGPKGEKLMVHPFYDHGTLAQFIRDGNAEAHKWQNIHKISIGIARALDYLHTSMEEPIIHGNLKSKNILLDRHYHSHVSDFGLHLLLNHTAGEQMLETLAAQGYKAPELIKMKDVSEECDIYCLGVIFLEILTGKEPIELPNAMKIANRDHQIVDLCRPEILLGQSGDQRAIIEDRILQYFQLSMACCIPAASQRPDIKQILSKLEEIGR